MKTIVLGYANVDAKGPAKVLAGPEASIREQVLLVAGIKSGVYPSGIVRVEHCELRPITIGIEIASNKTSETKGKKSEK